MSGQISIISENRALFFQRLNVDVHLRDKKGRITNADADNKLSKSIAALVAENIGVGCCDEKPSGQTLGLLFEKHVRSFLNATFCRFESIRPGPWRIIETKLDSAIYETEQYAHLKELGALISQSRNVWAALGNDYVITPDIVILRESWSDLEINKLIRLVDATSATRSSMRRDLGAKPMLHANISCKWTLRSDRAQNARSEALNLIRNRKGHTPHIAVVTAEPMPSRIASLAIGTGDIDCVYHFALPELVAAVQEVGNEDSIQLLTAMVEGKRLKDISDLPLDLCV